MKHQGIFTISLDFELHWGGFEKWPLKDYRQYFLNTRVVIPQMLDLFLKYETHVTWATVGMLFHKTKKELLENAPQQKPRYESKELSAYHYIANCGIGEGEDDDPFHFAPSLIKEISETQFQEIGTHTFSHYYCNEQGQNIDSFRDDLRAAQRAARSIGRSLESLVFPRNQFNDHYLKACFEEGINAVRSNPSDWFWEINSTLRESRWKRLNRGLDAYIPVGRKTTFAINDLEIRRGFPVCIPASRLLRPYRPKEFFLNDFKIARIKREITQAAKEGEVYHLWWHPHNFGSYPAESITALEAILTHYCHCSQTYGMRSLNMGEISALLNTRRSERENKVASL